MLCAELLLIVTYLTEEQAVINNIEVIKQVNRIVALLIMLISLEIVHAKPMLIFT